MPWFFSARPGRRLGSFGRVTSESVSSWRALPVDPLPDASLNRPVSSERALLSNPTANLRRLPNPRGLPKREPPRRPR